MAPSELGDTTLTASEPETSSRCVGPYPPHQGRVGATERAYPSLYSKRNSEPNRVELLVRQCIGDRSAATRARSRLDKGASSVGAYQRLDHFTCTTQFPNRRHEFTPRERKPFDRDSTQSRTLSARPTNRPREVILTSARSKVGRVTARGRARQTIWLLALVAMIGAPFAFALGRDNGGALLFVAAMVLALFASFAVASDSSRDDDHKDH